MELKTPKYDLKTNKYILNFSEIFNKIQIDKNTYKIIRSMYNCIYVNYTTGINIFSIVKIKSSDKFPSFMFYYDDAILYKKDVIYLIKKIIDKNFN